MTGSPGPGGLVLALDHLCHQGDRIVVEPWDRLAGEGLPAQQQGLAEAQVVDAAGITASGQPGKIGRIAPGAPWELEAKTAFQGLDQAG